MALSRFDNRKQMVIKESNAIGTAVLRYQLLPDMVALLKIYTSKY